MCARPLEAFSSFLRTFPVFAGKSLPAAFCALQGCEKPDLWREITLSQAQKGNAQASTKAEPYRVRLRSPLKHGKTAPPNIRKGGIIRHVRTASQNLFPLFPVRSPSLREKVFLRSSAPCRGVEKLIFGEKKACLRHKTATHRLPRRRSRTVSGSLCQPSGRTAERPHGGRKNGKGGAQAFLQRCGQKKTPASRERPALSDRKKG